MNGYRLVGGPLDGQTRAWEGRLGQVNCEMVSAANPPAVDDEGLSSATDDTEACYICMQEDDQLFYRYQSTHDAQP